MPANTPAYAKNIIRRTLRELVDPSPSKKEIATLWEFFDYSCAYCGCKLRKGNKEAHIDHLVSASGAGANHIANRVLSCAKCNEKEKLDQAWEVFLEKKCPDRTIFAQRHKKIEDWINQASDPVRIIDPSIIDEANASADTIIETFNNEVMRIRALRHYDHQGDQLDTREASL